MWWESLLLATIPALLTLITTNFYNKSKHKAEVQRLVQEGKGVEAANMDTILQSYNVTLAQYKLELDDVNRRFSQYISDANKVAEINRQRISSLEITNRELKCKVETLEQDICMTQKCVFRTPLKNNLDAENINE